MLVKLYAGDDYTWGWTEIPGRPDLAPQLTLKVTPAGSEKLSAAFGAERRQVWQIAAGDPGDPREHMLYTNVKP